MFMPNGRETAEGLRQAGLPRSESQEALVAGPRLELCSPTSKFRELFTALVVCSECVHAGGHSSGGDSRCSVWGSWGREEAGQDRSCLIYLLDFKDKLIYNQPHSRNNSKWFINLNIK